MSKNPNGKSFWWPAWSGLSPSRVAGGLGPFFQGEGLKKRVFHGGILSFGRWPQVVYSFSGKKKCRFVKAIQSDYNTYIFHVISTRSASTLMVSITLLFWPFTRQTGYGIIELTKRGLIFIIGGHYD